jgi:epoxyqueuosine reductase QueG
MARDLKQGLVNRLRQVGAYDVGIADPNVGFEYAVERKHPLDLWKQSRSVVVFALACSSKTDHTYAGTYAPWKGNRNIGPVPQHIQSDDYGLNRLVRLFIESVTLKGMAFLQASGCNVSFSKLQLKLSAFEAGLGVYGRSGLIIHPVLGNRLRFGGILTDAVLEPDGVLEGFEPCENCDLCIKMCPAKAFDPTKRYPYSYSEEKCISKLAKIADKGLYCDNCSAVCPPGKFKDEELLCIKEAKSFFKRDRG